MEQAQHPTYRCTPCRRHCGAAAEKRCVENRGLARMSLRFRYAIYIVEKFFVRQIFFFVLYRCGRSAFGKRVISTGLEYYTDFMYLGENN